MLKIILLLSLAVFHAAEDTRNVHSPCSILLNEVSFSKPSYIEIGKFCPSLETQNVHELLAGYYLLIIDPSDLKVRYFKSLERCKVKKVDPTDRGAIKAPQVSAFESATHVEVVKNDFGNGLGNPHPSQREVFPIPIATVSAEGTTISSHSVSGDITITPRSQLTAFQIYKEGLKMKERAGESQILDATKSSSGPSLPTPRHHLQPSLKGTGQDNPASNMETPGSRVGILRRPAGSKPPVTLTPRPTSPPRKRQRQKRSTENYQANIYAIKDVELGEAFDQSETMAVILLYLPYNRRKSLWERYSVGQTVTESGQAEIQEFTHDFLLFTSSDKEEDQSHLLKLLPAGADMDFLNILVGITEYSFSKCDDSSTPFNSNGFIYSTRTKGTANLCTSYKEPQPFNFKGKSLRAQSKELVINAVTNLKKKMKDPTWLHMNPAEAASAILNLSRTTIYQILKIYEEGEKFSDGKKPCRQRPVTELDDQYQKVLYDIITGYYKRNVVPRFRDVLKDFISEVRLKELQKLETEAAAGQVGTTEHTTALMTVATPVGPIMDEEIIAERPAPEIYHCGARSFSKILEKYGYKYGKIRSRDAQIFKPANLEWRKKYLEAIKKYDDDPEWNVIYQDETWIDPHMRADRGWVLKNYENFQQRLDFTFKDAKISRGTRLIILAAGGKDGFITGATEAYPVPVASKRKNEAGDQAVQQGEDDYHSNVNGEKFLMWIEKVFKILGNKKSVIILDNCPFHRVLGVPKESDLKEDVRKWLQEKKDGGHSITEDVSLSTKLTKAQLMAIVNRLTDDSNGDPEIPRTKVQQLAKKYGHRTLRMPPYNPDLNPIEYVWSDIKREVREKNTEQTVPFALTLAKKELNSYTADQWRNHIRHVKKIEDQYRYGDQHFSTVPEEQDVPTVMSTQELEAIDEELGRDSIGGCDE